ATLTGAMIVTLAHEYAGLFANDDALAEQILASAKAADEPVWRMPMGKGYDKMIDSPNADMKNIGGREGGSITAAQFLKRFITAAPWAHLDIAPTAWRSKSDDPRQPTWATGWGVRALDRLIADHYES
ncbi:MAG: leucyl aminopeptidase, partial [Caulobacterales bacterium]|nr:leucyl aminopeptidase [Caulobacterales bacterium]